MTRRFAMRAWRRRVLEWLEAARLPAPLTAPDAIGDNLRAAIAAEERAHAENVQTYQARVEAMIGDFFARYGTRRYGNHDVTRAP